MEEQEKQAKRRLEKKSGTTFFLIFFIIALLLLAAILYFYPRESTVPEPLKTIEVKNAPTTATTIEKQQPVQQLQPDLPVRQTDQTDQTPETLPEESEKPLNTDNPILPPESPTAEITEQTDDPCSPYLENVESFFEALDTKAYIKDFSLDQKSRLYFPILIQRLVDNPPVVTGETDDLYTVLQNTAHFFRIIGKKNIFVLKGILDREKETFEQTLADFYNLTHSPSCLEEKLNLKISDDAL